MMINPIWFEYTFLAFLTCTTNLWMMTILQKPMATSLYHHLALCFFINQNAQKFVVESIKFARQSPPLSRHTKCERYHLTIKRIRQFPIYSSGTVLWKTFVMFFIITHSFTNFYWFWKFHLNNLVGCIPFSMLLSCKTLFIVRFLPDISYLLLISCAKFYHYYRQITQPLVLDAAIESAYLNAIKHLICKHDCKRGCFYT